MNTSINTFGALKASGYISKSIKNELRDNLIVSIQEGKNTFPGMHGYEDTVIPQLERAILSKHNINLLGLRGQGKTRIARLMINLLDEYIPVLAGSEMNDDPFHPISRYARDLMEEKGDDAPITWLHRSERFFEKLATPDVTIADLIGDIDPIKASNLKLSYADERVIHFGMIPRANRCLFVINELPDLQARIQVALFNILEEGDVQIRGFKLTSSLRSSICIYCQSGRLHQSRKHCHSAERPHWLSDLDALLCRYSNSEENHEARIRKAGRSFVRCSRS